MAKIKKRRREVNGEYVGRREAIRNFCMECMGYQMAEIKKCTAKECWLYPWRLGVLDSESLDAEKEMVKAKKEGITPKKKKKKAGFKFKEL